MLYLHLLSIWYWMAVDLHESGIQSRHHLLPWCWMHLNFGPSVAQASVHLWEVIKRNTMLYIINRRPHTILKFAFKAYSPRYLFCIFFLDCWFKRKRYLVCFDLIYETLFYRPNYFGNYSYNMKYGNILQKTRQPRQ